MAEAGAEPSGRDPDAIDLTDPELYRRGSPHAVFSRLRRGAPWGPCRVPCRAGRSPWRPTLDRARPTEATVANSGGVADILGPGVRADPGAACYQERHRKRILHGRQRRARQLDYALVASTAAGAAAGVSREDRGLVRSGDRLDPAEGFGTMGSSAGLLSREIGTALRTSGG